MKSKNLIIVILILVLVAGGSFFAGTKYQQRRRVNSFRQDGGQFFGQMGRGGGQFQGNRVAFRPVNGEIISSDDKSITVKLVDGSSKIILISDKTQINKADTAILADLKTGEKVAIFGQENSDGSITAQNIQLNPEFQNMGNQ